MKHRKNTGFVLIAAVIGLMIAIQFQTVSEPVERDTRDTWELREDLMEETELQTKLIQEIRSVEEKLAEYKTVRAQSKEQVLKGTLEELKQEAGLTEVTGAGLVLSIEPDFDLMPLGNPAVSVSPELLKRLINELNMYGAQHISVDGQRVINTTVIRIINRDTKIDGHSLNRYPINIKVIVDTVDTAEKLYNRMSVSGVADDFFIDSLRVNVNKPEPEITIPSYQDTIRIRYMEPVNTEKGDNG